MDIGERVHENSFAILYMKVMALTKSFDRFLLNTIWLFVTNLCFITWVWNKNEKYCEIGVWMNKKFRVLEVVL